MIGAYFATAYDEARTSLELPLDVTSGRDEGLCIVDQVIRGVGIVGRVTGSFGAVAVKVHATGKPVRVAVALRLDDMGTRRWADQVKPSRMTPERPRLVLVRAQGEVKGAALLARRQGWRRAGGATDEVVFDLTTDELDADGLLVIEVAEAIRPDWTNDRVSPRSALGLRIDRITVAEQDGPLPPLTFRPTGCDLALLPPGGPGSFRLDTSTVNLAPPLPRSPSNRITRRKQARAVFKAGRIARRVAVQAGARVGLHRSGGSPGVLAADLSTGEPVAVTVVNRRPDSFDLRLDPPPGAPVLIGLDAADPGLSCQIVPSS